MADLKRLVYSPKAYAFIYSRKKNGAIIDVSNDISGGSVQRFINKPSTATLTLRNDNWKYTGRFQPMFFPMDGITIWLQRFAGRPVQVFTGFIDTIPYYQAYPGEIEIKATCTLKQFLYTHFDPGTGFLDWLTNHGWVPNANNGNMDGFFNPEALSVSGDSIGTDSGMGKLLHDFMIDIGGVDPKAIVIGDLPKDLPSTMLSAFTKKVDASKAAQEALKNFLGSILSISVSHDAEQGSDLNSKFPTGLSQNANPTDVKELLSALNDFKFKTPRPTEQQMLLAATVMSGLDKDFQGTDSKSPSLGRGYFADPNAGAKAVGSHGSVRGQEDMSPKKQGTTFCERWQQILKDSSTVPNIGTVQTITSSESGMTPQMIADVARVIAYGYGKEKFYSQILESCNAASNQNVAKEIINCITSNANFDSVNSLEILSAGEVQEKTSPLSVTWDAIFKADNSAADVANAEKITADGKNSNGGMTSLETNKTYQSPFGSYSPKSDTIQESDLPRPAKQVITYSDIEYFVHSVGETKVTGNQAKFESKYIIDSSMPIGSILLIKNPTTGKSCRCVYMGPTTGNGNTKAPFTISPKALGLLGIPNTKNGSVAKNELTVQVLAESLPAPQSSDKSPADQKKDYLSAIKALLGQPAAGTKTEYFDTSINDSDRNAFKKWYEGGKIGGKAQANDRLAEYFYVASNYDIHLMDFERTHDNRMFLQGDPVQIVEFLKHTGIVSQTSSVDSGLSFDGFFQSVPKGLQVTLDGGSTYYQINPKTGQTSKRSTGDSPEPIRSANSKGTKGIIIVEADGNDPKPVWDGATVRLPESTLDGANANGATDLKSATTWSDVARIATSAAFSTLTAFPWDTAGSALLVGEKSLMNDVPVMQGIEQLCQGSMRKFMSLPNGMFCAFYPDEFGRFGRKPYMSISDVEIIDFNIVLNDEPLVTHMYVNGKSTNFLTPSIDQTDMIMSVGVITVDDVLSGNLNIVKTPESVTGITGDASDNGVGNMGQANAAPVEDYPQFNDGLSKEALEFLQVYGTRPLVKNEPLIKSAWFEFVTAYNEFCHHWSMHTATTVNLTFMPELLAGGLVKFEDQNIIMFVEGVNHSWSYSAGFETSAFLSSPSTDDKTGDGVPGLVLFNSKL